MGISLFIAPELCVLCRFSEKKREMGVSVRREGEKSEITANGKRGHVTECRSEKEEEKRVR